MTSVELEVMSALLCFKERKWVIFVQRAREKDLKQEREKMDCKMNWMWEKEKSSYNVHTAEDARSEKNKLSTRDTQIHNPRWGAMLTYNYASEQTHYFACKWNASAPHEESFYCDWNINAFVYQEDNGAKEIGVKLHTLRGIEKCHNVNRKRFSPSCSIVRKCNKTPTLKSNQGIYINLFWVKMQWTEEVVT